MIKGSHHTKAHNKSMSKRMKGNINAKGSKWTEDRRINMSRRFSGENNPFFGKKHSKKILARIGMKNRKENMSLETTLKMRSAKLGKKLSKEHKNKISIANLGKHFDKHTEEAKEKNRIAHLGKRAWNKGIPNPNFRGAKNPRWKGDITPINLSIRHSPKYKQWRESVFKRDNYTCVIGGKKHGSKLNADHIKSFADFPILRFEILNGRTLCVVCHRKTPNFGNRKIS